MKKSLLISFEGIEGSGKSTQIKLFQNFLDSQGIKHYLFREPGGTQLGEKIRTILLDDNVEISPMAELTLFISSRIQLLETEILPVLKQEKCVVILDRFKDSSYAYQGAGRNLGVDTVKNLHSVSPLNTTPDLTIYLDISPENSKKRVLNRGEEKDKMEQLDQSFFKRVRDQYLQLNSEYSHIKLIDAMKDIDDISHEIQSRFKDTIK